MSPLDTLRLLFTMAVRNIRAHWVKSIVVGGILFFGTFLVVLGSSVLDSVQASMEKSITSSLAGHMQVYDQGAKDALALFGSFGATTMDVGEVENFVNVRDALEDVPEVEATVPMGIVNTTLFSGTELDRVLERLRDAVDAGDAAAQAMLQQQVRGIAAKLRTDLEGASALTADKGEVERALEALDRVMSDAFWADFATSPAPALDYLDTTVAPLAADGRMLYLRVLGTDIDAYKAHFDRFRIVDGEVVPTGKRGIMFSKRFYEAWVKNKVARELDQIREDMKNDGKTLAEDAFLRERVARNARGYDRILFQLTPDDQRALTDELRKELPGVEGDTGALLQAFLEMDDSNFEARYQWFYDHIAPRIRLYDAPVGETITLKAYTKSGYIRAVNVKVWGTFTFDGLETSDLASAANLTDLVTFRSLYGKMSADQQAELSDIREKVGVKEISRENAEDALFGGGGSLEADATPAAAFDEFQGTALAGGLADDEDHTYTQAEIDNGVVLNVAVILKDPSKIVEGMEAVKAHLAKEGLTLQVVDWKTASGVVGQLIFVLQAVLYFMVFFIFFVALVVINIVMVLSTVERTTEIGTMRAIGSQRGWVVSLFVWETIVLGLLAGGLGAAVAAGTVGYLGIAGIPAVADQLVLLFGGPRLYPLCGADNIAFGIVSVVGISALSAFYPALLAARVQPVVAMAQKE